MGLGTLKEWKTECEYNKGLSWESTGKTYIKKELKSVKIRKSNFFMMMYLIIQSFLKLDFVLTKQAGNSVSKTYALEEVQEERTYVYLQLIYVVVWQKPTTTL